MSLNNSDHSEEKMDMPQIVKSAHFSLVKKDQPWALLNIISEWAGKICPQFGLTNADSRVE
jgi:hypothetical protein